MAFKILSIDGGGLGGKFPAAVLSTFEDHIGEPIYKYFDLIVGTSTGGIIAICLALGIPAADVLRFYQTEGSQIFRSMNLPERLLRLALGKPLHDPKLLSRSLKSVLKDSLIGHARTRLVVPATDARTGQMYVYKTAHHDKLMTDYKKLAVDAASATSAAPIYFPEFANSEGIPLLDGMLWANNPILVGISEAVGLMASELNNIRVLSIGCVDTDVSASTSARRRASGHAKLSRLKDLFLKGQSLAALNQAGLLIGKQSIIRVECTARSGVYEIDDSVETADLVGEGARLGREYGPKVKSMFFDCQAPAFEPKYHVPTL